MWSFEPVEFWACGGQVPTKASLCFSDGQGRENIVESSWVGIRTGSDHSPLTVKTGLNWENKFITNQNQIRIIRSTTNLKNTFPQTPLIPRLSFIPDSLSHPLQQLREMGMGVTVSSLHIVSAIASSSGRGIFLLFQCGVPPMGDSSLWKSPKYVLPTGCSSSQTLPVWISL